MEPIEYRVALLDSSLPMVMALLKPEGYCLPRVFVSKQTRFAESINETLRREWQLNTLILTVLHTNDERPSCVVVEVLPAAATTSSCDLTLQPVDALKASELNILERASIQDVIASDVSATSPFSHRGWLVEAKRWIQECVCDRYVRFNSDIRQLNGGSNFALVRLATENGPAFWFKATGEPNTRELTVTAALSRLFPEYLPPLIATRPDWNAWVSEEAGCPIRGCMTLEVMESVTLSLAHLQMKSITHREELIAAGCLDHSLPVLKGHLREITSYLEEAMSRQTSAKVPRLGRPRLYELESIVADACDRMQDLGIPNSLVHNDLNLGNVLIDGSRCTFIDWAEGYLGNPFLAFQHLCAYFRTDGDSAAIWTSRMRDLYRSCWLEYLTEAQIDVAFSLMPILAIFSYLYGSGDWTTSPRREGDQFQAYMRSLARHMDRAARAMKSREALCLPA